MSRPVVLYVVPAAVAPARDWQRERRRSLIASVVLATICIALAVVLVAVN